MCESKENGVLGFKSFGSFNVALLAKQGWRLFKDPESLIVKVMKAKYFPNEEFLQANLKSYA